MAKRELRETGRRAGHETFLSVQPQLHGVLAFPQHRIYICPNHFRTGGTMRVHVKTCVLPLLLSAVSFGQTFYGSIIGLITDPTGSSVPTAVVTLTNIGTSDRRTAATDYAGNYQFINLVPGQYKLEIEHPGFRRFVREPITVEVQSAVRIDVPLSVGDVTQTVEVSGQIATDPDRECIPGPSGRCAKGPGNAAERAEHLRLGGASPRRCTRRPVRHYPDRNQSVRLGKLSDRRRTVQPERFLHRRSTDQRVLRQFDLVGSHAGRHPGIPCSDEQPGSRVWTSGRRSHQSHYQVGYQQLSWDCLRILPQPRSQRQHVFQQQGSRPAPRLLSKSIRRQCRRAHQTRPDV